MKPPATLTPELLIGQADFVVALSRSLLADPHAADDVAQDTLVAALQAPPAETDALRGWLARVVRNFARLRGRGEQRRSVRERSVARPEHVPSTAEVLERESVRAAVVRAVLELDEPYRTAILLRFFENRAPREIAELRRLPIDTVHTHTKRALALLRRRLDGEFGSRSAWAALLLPFTRPPLVPAVEGAPAPPASQRGKQAHLELAAAGLVLVAGAAYWLWPKTSSPARPTLAVQSSATLAEVPEHLETHPHGPARVESQRAVPSAPSSAPAPNAARLELRGRVRGPDGAPLSGASVQVHRPEFRGFDLRLAPSERTSEPVAAVESDARGEFQIALAAGERVDLEAQHGGFCPAFAADRGAGDFVELELPLGLSVRGRITRVRDGAPVAGALVSAVGGVRSSTTSAEDGTYALRVATAEARLRVEPRVEQSTLLLPLAFDADGLCVLDVALEDGVRVEGRVTERDTQRPISGARVYEGRAGTRRATTDARGEYVLAGFGNPDVAVLHATAPGYGVTRGALTTPVDGRMRVDFELAHGRRARGRVVDERADPVPGARVLAVGTSNTDDDWRGGLTRADGAFELTDLAPEMRHALLISAPGRATQVHDFPADERTRAEVELGTLVLRTARALRGRVVDASGAGIGGVIVSLSGWNADRFALAGSAAEPTGAHYVAVRERQSDASGRFTFEDLAPGEYTLGARSAGRPRPAEQLLQIAGEDVEATIVLTTGGGGIRGLVLDEEGRPLAKIHVNLSAEELRDPRAVLDDRSLSMRTAADGAFEFSGLPEGLYALELFPTAYGPEDLRAPLLATNVAHAVTGGAPLRVELVRGLTIEGVLQDAHGAALGNHSVSAVGAKGEPGWTATTDPEGRFAIPLARGTTWTLEVYGPGQLEGAPLRAVPGVAAGTLDVRIQLP